MPANDKVRILLETLLQRTQNGKAKWTTGSRDDTYIWSGSAASVVLLTKDNDGFQPWWVRLVDADGRTVEEEEVDVDSDLYNLLADLYPAARSDALNISSTIDGLLDDLGV